ncbi:hypothetical protein KGQ27_02580 [Patescibacteria group bacterium]|nr:hypothetical protein [Patescibacteria group bacterium]MDE1946453.1 hypothetical protein [Patescibacteria group bacterium]MDE2011060.1 hypothetical protein [Patescibacteria group bacterium]MDE2233539.1 hypothetical protein [Patescibacteria group bacterium]
MPTLTLDNISDKDLEKIIPLSDFEGAKKPSNEGVFVITVNNGSPTPFPLNPRENETVDLEVAIRRCKRVGVFNGN